MCGTFISPIALTALSLSSDRPFYNVTARREDGRDSAGYPIIVFIFRPVYSVYTYYTSIRGTYSGKTTKSKKKI